MRSRLQFDLGKMRNGIFATARHLAHLFENQRVIGRGVRRSSNGANKQERSHSPHSSGINGKSAIEQW